MRRSLPGLFLAASIALAPTGLRAQAAADSFATKLQPVIEQWMAAHQVPGLAIAVLQDQKVVYAAGFGVRSLANSSDKVTPRTLFALGANAATFVSTSVMQLVEQGKIELDAPVTRYLPYFQLRDARFGDITIRHLLSHASGLPEVRDWEWDKPQHDDGALERYVRSLKDLTLIAAPGTKFGASDSAWEILGDVVAKVSGMTFEDYVRTNIFEPLAMTDSTSRISEADPALLASPHVLGDGYRVVVSDVFPYNRRHSASSTRYSNVLDMARWAQAHLNRGELDGRRILDAATYTTMWAPASDKSERRTLGWWQRENARVVYQNGQDTGFTSWMIMLPRQRSTAVILLSNANTGFLFDLGDRAIDVAFGQDPKPLAVKPSIGRHLYNTIALDGADAAARQYRELKQTRRDAFNFEARELNTLGYMLLGEKKVGEAVEMFRLNVEAYPELSSFWSGSANASVHDGLGDAYMWSGDKALAIESFEKSIALDPNNVVAAGRLKTLRAAN